MNLYTEDAPRKLAGRPGNALKGKKINDSLSQKSFKRDSLQAPPNLDMIAKFAAEKEKCLLKYYLIINVLLINFFLFQIDIRTN